MKGGGSYFLPLARAPIVVSFQSSCARCCVLSPCCPVNFVQYFTHLSIFFSPLSSPEPCNSSSRVFLYFPRVFPTFPARSSLVYTRTWCSGTLSSFGRVFLAQFLLSFSVSFVPLRSRPRFRSPPALILVSTVSVPPHENFAVVSLTILCLYLFYVRCHRPFPQAIH